MEVDIERVWTMDAGATRTRLVVEWTVRAAGRGASERCSFPASENSAAGQHASDATARSTRQAPSVASAVDF